MNLSQFSLLKEDDNSYHLSHPRGETFQVPKKGLTDKAHALIKKLRKNQSFAQGGQIAPEEIPFDSLIPAEKERFAPNREIPLDSLVTQEQADKANNPLYGLPPGTLPPPSQDSIRLAEGAAPTSIEFQTEQKTPVSSTAPKMNEDRIQEKNPFLVGKSELDRSLEEEKNQLKKLAGVEKQAAGMESKAYQEAAAGMQKLPSIPELTASFKQKDAQLEKAFLDKKIDPERYLSNQGTGTRIASAIGMMLSGIGSGITGQPNLAVQRVNQAIEKDIEAQKEDKSSAMNLWKMNREAFGNDMQANLATQSQLLTVAKTKAMSAAAQSNNAQAQMRLIPLINDINQKQAAIHQQQALFSQMNSGGSSELDPAQLVSTLVPEHHQQEVFKEIKRAQDTRHMGSAIVNDFDQAAKDVRPLSGGRVRYAIPGVTSPYVKAFHQSMQPTFQDLEGTVRQAAMDNTFENMTPQFGDSDETIATKRQALTDYLESKKSAPTAKGFHIDLDRFRSTNSSPAYKPGQVVDVKGVQYVVNSDGSTATRVR